MAMMACMNVKIALTSLQSWYHDGYQLKARALLKNAAAGYAGTEEVGMQLTFCEL